MSDDQDRKDDLARQIRESLDPEPERVARRHASRAARRDEADAPGTLAERIKARMEVLRLNPYSAAKKADLGPDFVRDILRGKVKSPSAERLGKLAEALETSLNYLMGADEVEPGNLVGPGVYEPPPPPYIGDATPPRTANILLLPIRYELLTDTYRKATDVVRAPLGWEATGIPAAFKGRTLWWELQRDDSMAPRVPPGALVLVAEYDDTERDQMVEGDIIVIQKRMVEAGASIHFIERSLRVVSERYPDLGLWFMEYGNEEWGISDDIFRDNSKAGHLARQRQAAERSPTPPIRHQDLDPEGLWKEGLDPEFAAQLEETMDREYEQREHPPPIDVPLLDLSPEDFKREMERLRSWRPKLVGKVIRVLIPTDPRAKFGKPTDPF